MGVLMGELIPNGQLPKAGAPRRIGAELMTPQPCASRNNYP